MAETKKSQRVSVSKKKLSETAEGLEVAAIVTAVEGEVEIARGAETLQAAGDLVRAGAVELASGASDLTRAEDLELVSERMSTLSEVVAVAGVTDVAQGAEMLASSDDVNVMSAIMGLMSEDDIEHGLELARLSGELMTVSEVVASLQMPVLTEFLYDRGELLQEIAVEQIRMAASTRGLARAMASTGKKIAGLGENEVAEGFARMAVSEGMAIRSEELAIGGAILAEQGIEKVATAAVAGAVAREVVKAGVGEVAQGSMSLGVAAATDAFAEALDDKAQ